MVSIRKEDPPPKKKKVGKALHACLPGAVSKSMWSNNEVPEQLVAKIQSCYVIACTWRHLWKQDWLHRRVLNYIPALIGVPNSSCVSRFVIFNATYKTVKETLLHTSRHTDNTILCYTINSVSTQTTNVTQYYQNSMQFFKNFLVIPDF